MTNTTKNPSEEQLLVEIDDIIKTMPNRATIRHETSENFAWLGRASAAIARWNSTRAISFQLALKKFHDAMGRTAGEGFREVVTILYEAQNDLRIRLTGPLSVVAGQGMVFDFFDAVRKIIEQAKADILFVDPYLTPEFVARYLPHVGDGVNIRLLTSNKSGEHKKMLSTLIPAVGSFCQQTERHIEVRASGDFHDRYVFIDGKECHHSSQSFKDGAKSAPVMIAQILDTLPQTLKTYEEIWTNAASEYPTSAAVDKQLNKQAT